MTKRNVEALLGSYDDDPVAALSAALRLVLERSGDSWPELVRAANFTETRAAALLIGEQGALDDLASELNELRDLPSEG